MSVSLTVMPGKLDPFSMTNLLGSVPGSCFAAGQSTTEVPVERELAWPYSNYCSVTIQNNSQQLFPRHPRAGNVIPAPQPPLQHPANLLRQNHIRHFASAAWRGSRGAPVGDLAVTRGSQITVKFARICIEGQACDLPARIDAVCVDQKQGRTRGNQGVEVCHHAVLPQEGVFAPLVRRVTDHLAFVVDAEGDAPKVSWKGAEVGHYSVLPEEGVRCGVAKQVGITDHLTIVIDGIGHTERTSEAAEVSRRPVLPE